MESETTKGLYITLKKAGAVRDRRIYRLVGRLRRVCSWLNDSDYPIMRSWAEAEILGTVLYARLRDEGLTTASGEPKKILAEWRAVRSVHLALSRELGLTPAARKQIAGQGKGFDLAAEFAFLNAREAGAGAICQPATESAPEGTGAPPEA